MVIQNTYPKPSQIYQAKLELGGVKQFIPASDCAITDLQVLVASTSCCTACQAACARIPGTVVGTGPLQHLQVASTSCLTACGPILATVVGTGPLQHPRVASLPCTSCCSARRRTQATIVGTCPLQHPQVAFTCCCLTWASMFDLHAVFLQMGVDLYARMNQTV